jgi:2-oxo-4-hydroxy-4-carboxy-5-ureidoimidazoline decarboxylase
MGLTRHTIAALNGLSHEEFAALCGPVFEKSPWFAAEAASRRPFADFDAMVAAFCDCVRAATPGRQLELIRAHPDLVGRMTLTAESQREQAAAGLVSLSTGEIALFRKHNEAYRSRFGFPFIICARLNKKEAILTAFEKRLPNSRETEIHTALDEIFKIAALRLRDLVE